MNLALMLLIGGGVIIAWIYIWSRLQEKQVSPVIDQLVRDFSPAGSSDAVLVARGHGRLVHLNEAAGRWLGIDGSIPPLEQIARKAQPAESLLALFAGEAQRSFELDGRWIEASSHRLPGDGELHTVVVMRELSANTPGADVLNIGQAMSIINRIGETAHAGMSVEQVLQTLLAIIRQEVSLDAGEVCLWDDQQKALFQRGWIGDTGYVLALAEAGGRYEIGEGVSGWIAQHLQPVLLTTSEDFVAIQPKLADSGYQSIVAVPLMLGEQFIGTLELASKQVATYTQQHQALLQAISKPVAVAVYNAHLYTEQVKRLDDLTGLQRVVSAEQLRAEDAAPVYATLNARVASLLDADMSGVFLYDRDREALVPQVPFHGLPDAVVERLHIPLSPESRQRDIWENQSYWVANDLAEEPLVEALELSVLVEVSGIRNTAWIPLQVGSARIGVIAVSNRRTEGGFSTSDIQNLIVLASQAAVVVESVRLFQREKRMDTELVGLQDIANAIGALSHETEFYDVITERIANLMGIGICGVLLHEPETRRLVRKLPFYGVDDELIADYTIPLPVGSVMNELWEDESFWYSNRVQTDPLIFEAGLDSLVECVGIQKTLMAVLQASGRRLGVIQVANKYDGENFNDGDARLLMVFATQVATIIENVRLYQEVQRTAEQAQGLRRVAELAGNVLTAQESFTPVLAEVVRLMRAEVAFINVIDPQQNAIITHPRWVYGRNLPESTIQDLNVRGFEQSVALSRRPYLGNDLLKDDSILPGYKQIAQQIGLHNAILVPLIFGDRVLGEIGVANREGEPFILEDLEVMQVIASQTAAALDRLLLYEATGENLMRRLEELDAISRVSNELTVTLDLDSVLDVICKEAVATTRASNGTVALLKPHAAWDDPDTPEVDRRLGYDIDMPALAGVEQRAILAPDDTALVADYAAVELVPAPPTARSALAVAITYLDESVGVLHLFADEPNAFDESASAFLVTLAVKASLGYGNAMRYREQLERGERLHRRVEQLNRIFELGHLFQTNAEPIQALEATAYSVQESVGFDTVLMLLADEGGRFMRRVAHAGLPLAVFDHSKDDVITVEAVESLLNSDFEISESYFYPAEQRAALKIEGIEALNAAFEGNRIIEVTNATSWKDGDLLVVPILGAAGYPLGLMVLDRPHNNQRPDRTVVEVLEVFAYQAAAIIENTRLYRTTVRSVEQEAQLNNVMEAVSRTLDVGEIVRSVAQGTLEYVPFTRITVALRSADDQGFDMVRAKVTTDGDLTMVRDRADSLGESALNRTYTEIQDYLYTGNSPEMQQYQDLQSAALEGEETNLLLPLVTGGDCLGVVHMASDASDGTHFSDNLPLLRRMAQIVASAVQNARLFDQAVNLQVLNESVLESIQQGIVVLDQDRNIISINDFMRGRFDWDAGAVGKNLLVYRPELGELIQNNLDIVYEHGQPSERLNQVIAGTSGSTFIASFYLYPLRYGTVVRGAVLLVEDVTQRAQMEQAMQSRAEQLALLTEISSRITSSLDRNEVTRLALTEVSNLVTLDDASLWRRNGSYMVLQGVAGENVVHSPGEEVRVLVNDHPLIQQMVESRRVLVVNQPEEIPSGLPVHQQIGSWMGIPLVNQRHVVGMMMLTNQHPDTYTNPSDQNVAFSLASQVATALANADLFEQTFDRTNELSTLLEATQITSQTTELNAVLESVVGLMFGALGVDACSIMIWHDVDNSLVVEMDRNLVGDMDNITPKGTRYDLAAYPARLRALQQREVIVVLRDDSDATYPKEQDEMRARGYVSRMLVPLVVRESAIGLIMLEQSTEDDIVKEQKLRLARALGSQVAVTIENARLTAETFAHFEESLVINDLSHAISSTLDLDAMITIVRDQVPTVAGASELYLALYDADTDEITFPLYVRDGEHITLPKRTLAQDEVSFIIRQRRPLNLGSDYYSPDELRRSLGIVNGEGDARSYLGVPLMAGDQVHGVLAVRDATRTRAFTINEQRILTTVAAQLGAALQNARLFRQISTFADDLNRQVAERTHELQEERDRLDILYQITSELARTLDMDSLIPRAVGMIARAVNADDGVIMQFHPATDQLYTRAVLDVNSLRRMPDDSRDYHPIELLARWLIDRDEKVILVDNLHEVDYWDHTAPGAEPWHSALGALLETNEELHGAMVFLSRVPGAFAEAHQGLMVAAASQVAAAFNNAELYRMIREQAERLGRLLRTEQEEAEKNQAILEGIADGVILADSAGRIILFNASAERILQVPREQILDHSLQEIAESDNPVVVTWANDLQNRIDLLQSEHITDYTAQQLELDNERIVSIHLSPVYVEENFLGTVSVLRDITREVEADRSKSQFVSNVSHEFRTPLTPIKGYTDLLLMGAAGDVNDAQRGILTTIKQNVERLTVLVEDVLNISQIDSGRANLNLELVDLSDLVDSALQSQRSRPQHEKKALQVNQTIAGDLPKIPADSSKLTRAISNVIDNAFNYTPAGGTIDIDLRPDTSGRLLLIAVRDSGVGIPEDYRERIWRRFERHDDTALMLDVAGTGLGLPIVKEIVEMHGGKVWFESALGEGTTFFVTIPMNQPGFTLQATGKQETV